MLLCVKRAFRFAVFALASVSLLYSRTVTCTERRLAQKPSMSSNLNITHNFTHNEPQVLPVHRLCSEKNVSYCINGHCSVQENINMPSCMCVCTCHSGFLGERCERRDLSVKVFYSVEDMIAISCGVILLLICMCVLVCCCYMKHRGSKPALPYETKESRV